MHENKFRIIYDYNLSKLNSQYNQIKDFFKDHELYVYNHEEIKINKKFEYNIYLDIIQESVYTNFPCNKTILVVNDEYLINMQYIRRESFIDKPLILLLDVVDYYICLTKYSQKLLIKSGVQKKKIILLEGFVNDIYNYIPLTNKKDKKYVLFELDKYSKQDNVSILNKWLNNISDMNYILIIKYHYIKEEIIHLLSKLIKQRVDESKIYYYKNIIFFKEDSFLKKYDKDIQYVILNSSYFEFIIKLYEHVLKNRLILTDETKISKNILTYNYNYNYLLDDLGKLDYDLLTIISNSKEKLIKHMKKTQTTFHNQII
jgi:hypothetical protein